MWLLSLTILLLVVLYVKSNWGVKLPPGPFNWPIVGYLLGLDPKAPHITLTKLSKKYGPIYSLYLGNVFTVVISDAIYVRKLFSQSNVQSRPKLYITHGIMKGYGIIASTGERWKLHRKLAVTCTKMLGMVKKSTALSRTSKIILEQAQDFIKIVNLQMQEKQQIKLDPENYLRHNIGTILNILVFGKAWARDDKTWLYLQQLQEEGVKHIGVAGPMNFLPFMRYTKTAFDNYRYLTEGQRKTHDLYEELIKLQEDFVKKCLNSAEVPEFENVIQIFLYERSLLRQKNAAEAEYFCDKQFNHFLADMFGAGLDTTLVTLRWFLIFMALHQDYQKRVQSEIDSILPDNILNEDFPFLKACIAEAQRIRSVVPLGIPHSNEIDIEFEGYTIPANSMILPLQWAIHMDVDKWMNPEEYNPLRFIDEEGNCKKPICFMPFQLGKRRCPGDDFAKMILFTFAVTILKNFEISSDEEINLDGEHGITLNPHKHDLIFKIR